MKAILTAGETPPMVALRAFWGQDRAGPRPPVPSHDADPDADWLSVQQAACEFGVSESTLRRMIRNGELESRTLPIGGRTVRRVHVPGARHSRIAVPDNVIDIATGLPLIPEPSSAETVRRLERQVEDLSEALARALRTRQRSLPAGLRAAVAGAQPYASYRWLARRKRWWPFS